MEEVKGTQQKIDDEIEAVEKSGKNLNVAKMNEIEQKYLTSSVVQRQAEARLKEEKATGYARLVKHPGYKS